jgi:hypothetical protein
MQYKNQILSIFFIGSALCSSCSMTKSSGEKLFEVKDAYYQSWVTKDNERGTDIFLELQKVKEGVICDSIIFRGMELPLFIENKEGILHLKSILNTDISKIKLDFKVNHAPDQLIYRYNGIRHSLLLKNIRRENMKYY